MRRCGLKGCKPEYKLKDNIQYFECEKCGFSVFNQDDKQLQIDWDNAMGVKAKRMKTVVTKTVTYLGAYED